MKRLLKEKIKKYAKSFYKIRAKRNLEKVNFIFIIGFMRSGSTLLLHIIRQKKDVLGVGENWISYDSKEDLEKLISRTCLRERLITMRNKTFVDKILHNELSVDKFILRKDNVKKIFLLRKPEYVISSMQNNKDKFPHTESVLDSSEYYIGRAKEILEEIKKSDENKIIITYEEITKKTRKTLDKIGEFINSSSRLEESYEKYWFTGMGTRGDPTGKIEKGRIKSCKRRVELEIPKIGKCKKCFENILRHKK